jgi:quercetin dioxygenase-like cupin family protein
MMRLAVRGSTDSRRITPMKRRAFLAVSAAAIPAAFVAADDAPKVSKDDAKPKKIFKVAAGADRSGNVVKFENGGHLEFQVSAADTGGAMSVCVALTPADSRPPRHFHHEQDEWFYVVAGEYDFEVGDEKFHLKAGDSLFAPRKVPHAWGCVSEKPGTLMAVFQPAGKMEAFFQELPKYVGKARASKEEMAKLHADHGMTVTGPPLPGKK